MTTRDNRTDSAIARALRELSRPYTGNLEALARRIDQSAAPLLAARIGRPQLAWWDYAAQWGNALIPASVLLSFASIAFLVVVRPTAPSSQRERVTTVALASATTSASDVDRAIDDLVGARPRRPHRTR
jgi:hypothetical protein